MDNVQDDFISTVSHELRTPLTSIKGFSDTMLSSYDNLSDEQKKKFLFIIKEQSERLINLVENLLCVTRLKSASDTVVYKEVDVIKTLKGIIEILKMKFPNHKFVLNCSENLSNALCDVDKFQQVLLNIIDNACKYSEDGSKVTITINEKVITEIKNRNDAKNTYIAISVEDEGIGVLDTEKIFEKFSRLDNPLTRKVQGSGLGLYISKILIEKMNGKIIVEKLKNGSKFIVYIPVAQAATLIHTKGF